MRLVGQPRNERDEEDMALSFWASWDLHNSGVLGTGCIALAVDIIGLYGNIPFYRYHRIL